MDPNKILKKDFRYDSLIKKIPLIVGLTYCVATEKHLGIVPQVLSQNITHKSCLISVKSENYEFLVIHKPFGEPSYVLTLRH